MNDRFNNYSNASYAESPFATMSQFLAHSFSWMFVGLAISFVVAFGAAQLFGPILPLLVLPAALIELILVVVLSMNIHKMSTGSAKTMFIVYALLNGLTLSSIFYVYELGTISAALLVGALYFGIMAVYGANTDRNLMGWGPRLFSGLISLLVVGFIGGLLNLLIGFNFGLLDILYSAIGLFLFMGITAYDTQKLKYYYMEYGNDAAMLNNAAIYGALQLYLDFVNIFLRVLQLMGRRNRR